jgi:hypothetical protein
MIFVLLQMLNFLLAIEHLPAFDAKHFSIGLGLNEVKSFDEVFPFGGVSFDHL